MSSEPKFAEILKGCLYVVATPIGNLEDITLRALRVLKNVDLVAAEDTRSARILLSRYELKTRTLSYFKGNEAERCPKIIEYLKGDSTIALISESGMPGISDPGARLIAACIDAEIPVDIIPGPNAAVSALVLSGLPADRFLFLGFLPRGGKRRLQLFESLTFEPGTMIIYESPNRTRKTLEDLANTLGDRPAAVVRELTKLHQEVIRGTLFSLVEKYQSVNPRGEVTLLCGGRSFEKEEAALNLDEEIAKRVDLGEGPRQIADALAPFGRRNVYQRVLAVQNKIRK